MARALGNCSFCPGTSAKRFAYRISGVAEEKEPQISERESAYLRGLVYTYRRQIPRDVVTLARAVPPASEPLSAAIPETLDLFAEVR